MRVDTHTYIHSFLENWLIQFLLLLQGSVIRFMFAPPFLFIYLFIFFRSTEFIRFITG